MSGDSGAQVIGYRGRRPDIAPDAWVAPGATVIGAARLRPGSSVWYGAVIRADGDSIELGQDSNLQDGAVVHADPGFPVLIGSGVTIGHRVVLHGCTVEDGCLIGMGAVLLNGTRIGRGSLVAAGTVLLEGTVVPPGSLVAGVPGKVRRELTDTETETIATNARGYVERARDYASAATPSPRS